MLGIGIVDIHPFVDPGRTTLRIEVDLVGAQRRPPLTLFLHRERKGSQMSTK